MGLAPLEFEINFRAQRAIKGQAAANFLADHPVPAEWELTEEFPDEEIFLVEVLPPWEMCRRCSTKKWSRSGVPAFLARRRTYSHTRSCLLKLARTTKRVSSHPSWARHGCRNADTAATHLWRLGSSSSNSTGIREWASRRLAGIAASLAQFDQLPSEIPICERWVIPPRREGGTGGRANRKDRGILPYLSRSKRSSRLALSLSRTSFATEHFPVDLRERVQIRRAAPKYVFIHDILYRRSYEGLRFFVAYQRKRGYKSSKRHTRWDLWGTPSRPKLHLQTKRLGYYWPSMLGAPSKWLEHASDCQLHADYIHQSAGTTSPGPSHHGHSRLGDGHHWSHLS
ncbi:hypothetical protein H6P81_001842 [Aristolochia fimbriata]|uniref:Uncharacterized protein n=1 Tax=Aristolochia fimbriata TaxID=158543 RepID=A0AAV7F8Q0_ARIFI|nr:hypothetical protein H6P81_001842 [Aristolochia fimbriata]